MSDDKLQVETRSTESKLTTAQLRSSMEEQRDRRQVFIDFAADQMEEGVDYHLIQGKKSLGKPGAEKFCNLFGVTIGETELAQDIIDSLPQDSKDKGATVLRVKLYRNGEYIGAGIGARTLTQDKGDLNKMMKMAKKSAIIDAVISTFGLSDLFSQDLEEKRSREIKTAIVVAHIDENIITTVGGKELWLRSELIPEIEEGKKYHVVVAPITDKGNVKLEIVNIMD